MSVPKEQSPDSYHGDELIYDARYQHTDDYKVQVKEVYHRLSTDKCTTRSLNFMLKKLRTRWENGQRW